MNPQWYDPVMRLLSEANALDVWLMPVQMKKNRPGTIIEVLCKPVDADNLRGLLLRHTSTLGVRETSVARHSLPREIQTVQTRYGPVRVKIATLPDGSRKASPEHDDCVARAAEKHVTISAVWLAAVSSFSPPR
jgi:uncharacterized protein (DUF111 family)